MWQYARDRLSLDPGWQHCPECDCEFDRYVPFEDGLCPECARKKELEELANEESEDENENLNENER